MKTFLTTLIFLAAGSASGQGGPTYYSFSSALENADSAAVVSINCMHANEYGTDGCDSIPSNIYLLRNVKELNISESDVRTLPPRINELKKLKKLSLNYLIHLDYETELCKLIGLDSLVYLELCIAHLKTFPSCIGHIKTLENIDLSWNKELHVESVFGILKQLPYLQTLNLSGIDHLNVLPANINSLKQLHTLQLDYLENSFDYETSLSRLHPLNIKSLTLANNKLKTLPASIATLQTLEYVDLSDNFFDSLPDAIFTLKNIRHINIQRSSGSFIQLGKDIQKLTALERINLGGNAQLDGSETIMHLSKLPHLKDLDLFACYLDSIPVEIRDFPTLERLNLERNPDINFAMLFKNLSAIKSLKYLDLGDNNLTTLPKEAGLLTSLEYLSIGLNPIVSLPEEFYNLNNLKVLNIYGNYDSSLSPAAIAIIKERLPNCKIIDKWIFRE